MSGIMPHFRRHFFEPIYEWVRRSHKMRYWRELEKTQYLPESRLREIQWQRVEALMQFIWKNNQFYRRRFEDAGVGLRDIQSPEDLRRLPLLTKTEIRNNSSQMLSQGFSRNNLQHAKTGGSTGKPLDLFFTEECSDVRNASAWRHNRWSGWQLGDPIAACWGNPYRPTTIMDRLKQSLLMPMIYLDTMNVNEASVKTFVEELRRVRASILFGHAHSIYLFVQYLKKLGIGKLHFKGIISSSMMLIPSERREIEDYFSVKVIDRYGCEEVSLIGCECEKHEGMHVDIEHLFVEFIKDDGTPSSSGEMGRIVVTDLMNLAMPLVRYEVEDMGVPSDKKCSCGRGLPLMENVVGRVADFLVKSDGTKVAGISLIENTLTNFPGLDQMQIIQNDYKHFEIRLVVGHDYTREIEQSLIYYFKTVFGDDTTVLIILVECISPEKSGKYRFSICNVR